MEITGKVFDGCYGSGDTTCKVLVAELNYGSWYVVKGGYLVNFVSTVFEEGDFLRVEEFLDVDCFTTEESVDTLAELVSHIEDLDED